MLKRDREKQLFLVRTSLGVCRFCATDASMPSIMPTRELLGLQEAEYRRRYLKLLASRQAVIRREVQTLLENAGGRDAVLLCFESLKTPGQFCHRRIFAEWWESITGEVIPELTEARQIQNELPLSQPARPRRSSRR